MIVIDDSLGTRLVAPSRREMVDMLVERLGDEPEDWQIQKIAAACLGHWESLSVVVEEV